MNRVTMVSLSITGILVVRRVVIADRHCILVTAIQDSFILVVSKPGDNAHPL
jgi:hypothetical protein